MNVRMILVVASLAPVAMVGCGLDDGSYAKQGFGNASMAIINAEGEGDVLRTGTALNIATPADVALQPNTVYRVLVSNLRTGSEVGKSDLLTDMTGGLSLTTVAHDLGEFDDVGERDTLSVRIHDSKGSIVAEQQIALTPHEVHFEGHGFSVDEVQPPHIFSADSTGQALNSFVVGALPDPGEVAAPIYVAGKGLPSHITVVDIYVVRDQDRWQGKKLPVAGDPDHVFGPVQGQVDRGLLRATRLDWQPSGKDVGPYDILVDVDRNGTFDYSFSAKDGADGEQKVGVTVQYGAAWLRARNATVAAQLSVDAANAAAGAAADAAAQAEQAAVSGGPDTQKLAQQARDAANRAKGDAATATAAAGQAQQAFNQTLADANACQAQAAIADTAAKSAAGAAQTAGQLVKDATAAAAAYKAAMAAAMASKHLLVNLAYDRGCESVRECFGGYASNGTWTNAYSQSSKIYTYLNPPARSAMPHAFITKLVVHHQSWADFWNNPDKLVPVPDGSGRKGLFVGDKVVQMTGGTTQFSCTNSPPVPSINPQALPVEPGKPTKFDVVFVRTPGYYIPGESLLDVISHTTGGNLLSAKDLVGIPDDQIYGFQVTK